jgi:hypothetical protein
MTTEEMEAWRAFASPVASFRQQADDSKEADSAWPHHGKESAAVDALAVNTVGGEWFGRERFGSWHGGTTLPSPPTMHSP